jgi:hypothetical protein
MYLWTQHWKTFILQKDQFYLTFANKYQLLFLLYLALMKQYPYSKHGYEDTPWGPHFNMSAWKWTLLLYQSTCLLTITPVVTSRKFPNRFLSPFHQTLFTPPQRNRKETITVKIKVIKFWSQSQDGNWHYSLLFTKTVSSIYTSQI